MNIADVSSTQWQPFVWTLVGIAGSFALVAILSPRLFAKLNAWTSLWIDFDGLAKKVDKRVDIDHRVVPHSRLLGAMTIVATGVLASLSGGFPYVQQLVVLASLGLVGVAGLLALLSPRFFSRLAYWGGLWVDTDKYADMLNNRVQIDHHVLRHCRLFGGVVMTVVFVIATLLVVSV